jgi:hypothetical protein
VVPAGVIPGSIQEIPFDASCAIGCLPRCCCGGSGSLCRGKLAMGGAKKFVFFQFPRFSPIFSLLERDRPTFNCPSVAY